MNFVYFGEAKYENMDQVYEGQLQLADQGMMQTVVWNKHLVNK